MSPSPINKNEINFSRDQDLLRIIDDEIAANQPGLLDRLNVYKQFITIPDAVYFLIDTYKQHGTSADAVNILNFLVTDERTATLDELKTILKESNDMPTGWAATLYAQTSLGRNPVEQVKLSSGLNLEAMKKFK